MHSRSEVIELVMLQRKFALQLFYITQQLCGQVSGKNFEPITVVDDDPAVLKEVMLWAEDMGVVCKNEPLDPKLLTLKFP